MTYPLLRFVAAPLLAGVGAFCIRAGLSRRRQGHATVAWPTVRARIIKSQLTEVSAPRYGNRYGRVDVTYEYIVGDKTYHSARRTIDGTPTQLPDAAEALAEDAYAEGAMVWAFYNPANPAEAVLEHSAPRSDMYLVAGALFILSAAAMAAGIIPR